MSDLFGTKLAAANAKIAQMGALLAVAGVNIEADLPTPDAFRATLDTATNEAVAAAIAGPTAEAAALRAGLEASGIRIDAFTAEQFAKPEGASADALNAAATAVKTAVETRVAAKATKQIAATGHPEAIDTPTGQTGGDKDADATPADAAEFMATLKTITDPRARTTYFRKHEAKFPVR